MATQKKDKKACLKCLKQKSETNFYMANSTLFKDNLFPVCKDCIREELNIENPFSKEAIESLRIILQQMNRPFKSDLWISSVEEGKNRSREPFGLYWKNLQLNFKTHGYKESDFSVGSGETKQSTPNEFKYEIIDKEETIDLSNNPDRKDVIRMLGYDPFSYENDDDKPKLYSDLVIFLDESTLEDGFKLQAVIEIVIGFNQIDKINRAITQITNDPERMTTNSGGIKTLVDAKKNILQSLVKLAEENGISVKHNNEKSKGAGTLSGIIKALQEKGIEEAELNLFDIETAQGMRQVADLSNESIIKQLQFDENDYTQMMIEQRELIQELDSKVIKLEEENRLLKKELIKYKNNDLQEEVM